MSITAADLLAYGAELATGADEITWRNSVGRSYYSAYHTAKEWHSVQPKTSPLPAGMGMHKALIHSMQHPPVMGQASIRSKGIAYTLNHMRTLRATADYELGCTIDRAVADTVAEMARTVHEKAAG
ncbi:hypothetical protein [Aquincola tertiaricarbonis]|uniref:hypothetical protein n=1 Tax=Aquincola tertiaricarbonis TaxID=391953 RepID=UPI000614AEEB|nr:hypothetical protein [Aquincola tertiaricarbonis]